MLDEKDVRFAYHYWCWRWRYNVKTYGIYDIRATYNLGNINMIKFILTGKQISNRQLDFMKKYITGKKRFRYTKLGKFLKKLGVRF